MQLAFDTLVAYGLDPLYEATCYWDYEDRRRQSHWNCKVGGVRYTVHITPPGNPINYVTDGWNRNARVSNSPYTLGGDGPGFPALCMDGTWTQSGGIQGACSHHGGLAYPELVPDVDGYDPNNDGSPYNWCGASRDGDGDGVWCEGQ
jgi:hypothetical protein